MCDIAACENFVTHSGSIDTGLCQFHNPRMNRPKNADGT